eukprot:734953_1
MEVKRLTEELAAAEKSINNQAEEAREQKERMRVGSEQLREWLGKQHALLVQKTSEVCGRLGKLLGDKPIMDGTPKTVVTEVTKCREMLGKLKESDALVDKAGRFMDEAEEPSKKAKLRLNRDLLKLPWMKEQIQKRREAYPIKRIVMSKFISGYVDTLRRDNIQLEEIVQKLDPTGDTLQEHSAQRSMQIYIERKKTEAVSGKVASSDLYFKPLQREIQVMSVSRYQCRFVGLINPQVDPMNRKIPSLSWILEVINQTCSQKLTDEQKSAASTVLPLPEFLVEKLAPQLIDQQPEEKPVNSTEADACDEVCMNIYVASLAYCHSNVQVELFKEFLDEKHDPRTLSFYLEARDHISTLQRSHGREIMGPSFVEATMFAEIVANLFPNITDTSRFHLVNTLKRAA